jgi:hypothetical protein
MPKLAIRDGIPKNNRDIQKGIGLRLMDGCIAVSLE